MAYTTGIEGFIAEILNERFDELDQMHDIFNQMRKDSDKIKDDLILDIGMPDMTKY